MKTANTSFIVLIILSSSKGFIECYSSRGEKERTEKEGSEKALRVLSYDIRTSISLKRSLPSSWYIAPGHISSGPPEMSNISLWSDLRAKIATGVSGGSANNSPGCEWRPAEDPSLAFSRRYVLQNGTVQTVGYWLRGYLISHRNVDYTEPTDMPFTGTQSF